MSETRKDACRGRRLFIWRKWESHPLSGEHEEESGHNAGNEGEGRVDVFIVFTREDGVVRMDERLSVCFVMDTLRRHFR